MVRRPACVFVANILACLRQWRQNPTVASMSMRRYLPAEKIDVAQHSDYNGSP